MITGCQVKESDTNTYADENTSVINTTIESNNEDKVKTKVSYKDNNEEDISITITYNLYGGTLKENSKKQSLKFDEGYQNYQLPTLKKEGC